MSRRRRFRDAPTDGAPDQIDDVDDAEDGDGVAGRSAAVPASSATPTPAPVKLEIEKLHAIPPAPPRVGLLAEINAAIDAAERDHAFAAAGALHIAAHAATVLVAALPAARAAADDSLAARLATLAADLS